MSVQQAISMFSPRRPSRTAAEAADHQREIRAQLVALISESTKAVQHEFHDSEEPIPSGELTNELCRTLEALFVHGVRDNVRGIVSGVMRDVKPPEPNLWSLLLVISHSDVLRQIGGYSQIRTDVGKARSWLRLALNDGLLTSYIAMMLEDRRLLTFHYDKLSLFRDRDQMEIVQSYLRGLEPLQFALATNSTLLNAWDEEALEMAGLWFRPRQLGRGTLSQGQDVAASIAAPAPRPKPPADLALPLPEPQTPTLILNALDPDMAFEHIMRTTSVDRTLAPLQTQTTSAAGGGGGGGGDSGLNSEASSLAGELAAITSPRPPPPSASYISVLESYRENSPRARSLMQTPDVQFVFGRSVDSSVASTASSGGGSAELETSGEAEKQPPVGTERQPPVGMEKQPPLGTEKQPPVGTGKQPPVETEKQPLVGTEEQSPVGTEKQPPVGTEKQAAESEEAQVSAAETASSETRAEDRSVEDTLHDRPPEPRDARYRWLSHISPEPGLDQQRYTCGGCQRFVGMLYGEPRICTLDGLFYCGDCHTGRDHAQMPARIVHNWDFDRYPVACRSREFLEQVDAEPTINVAEQNISIYNVSAEMDRVRLLRVRLVFLNAFMHTCRSGAAAELDRRLAGRRHLCEHVHLFAPVDLRDTRNGSLTATLQSVVEFAVEHVMACGLCSQKGFVCEFCRDPRIIYPFELETTRQCRQCYGLYHSRCWRRPAACPRCERYRRRAELRRLLEEPELGAAAAPSPSPDTEPPARPPQSPDRSRQSAAPAGEGQTASASTLPLR